jgi:general secretion pathway protein D
MKTMARVFHIVMVLAVSAQVAYAQRADSTIRARNDSVMIRMVDVDIRALIQALAQYVGRPVLFGGLNGARVSLETPAPVPVSQVLPLLRGVLTSQNLELMEDSSFFRVRQREQPAAPAVTPTPGASQAAIRTIELFVIRLKHAKALDVAATVNALYGRASALGELGARPPTLSDELRQNQVPPVAAVPPQAVASVAGRPATLTGETTIVPDARGNALLIRAARADFELIEAAVRELDVRPLQVLIEVLIAEVRRDRSISFGVETNLPLQKLGSSDAKVSGSTTGIGLGDLVLKLMKVGGADIDATIRAAAARGDVSIVSRPVVITANNEPAQILVGSQRPFVQVARALPTDAGVRDQVVQYKDVGTKLVVTPTISADGYVMLEVTQEVNAATTETQFDAPIISTRSVQTKLLVRDGQTVTLGGLTDRQRDMTQGGVPFLSAIPIVGGLFGRVSRQTTETELFLFLTPRVIRSDEEAADVTDPYRKKAERIKP